jgi:hypothetical protein
MSLWEGGMCSFKRVDNATMQRMVDYVSVGKYVNFAPWEGLIVLLKEG